MIDPEEDEPEVWGEDKDLEEEKKERKKRKEREDLEDEYGIGFTGEDVEDSKSYWERYSQKRKETTKEWKNRKLSENLNKKWGFSMNLDKLKK